jgi:putative PIN family toxin of toxin-antitoxin system
MKAILDTSVYVSMLISGQGVGVWLMALWKEQRYQILISPDLMEELVEVLQRPPIAARVAPYRSLALVRRLRDDAIWVDDLPEVSGLPDPQDNFLLGIALNGEADFIVTWNKPLLKLAACQGVRIITPDQFASLIIRTTKDP